MATPTLFELPAPDPDPVLADRPVGPVIETAIGPEGLATATYDETQAFRFRLSRVWDHTAPRCCFVMLNPSTATALVLDPTVTRCHRFARARGFGALEVTNIFALRSTDPRALYAHDDPVGQGNDDAILAAASAATATGGLVVCAWGTHGALLDRGHSVRELLEHHGIAAHVLRLTKDGHPNHPLYLPSSLEPVRW